MSKFETWLKTAHWRSQLTSLIGGLVSIIILINSYIPRLQEAGLTLSPKILHDLAIAGVVAAMLGRSLLDQSKKTDVPPSAPPA